MNVQESVKRKTTWLQGPFGGVEVPETIQISASDKARALTVTLLSFYQTCWPIIKGDIMKAVEYSYGQDMGFSRKWLKSAFFFISTVRFSVLINGSPVGFFPSQMGLRLDDHLSPFLLVLVMEGFNRMLRIANHSGWIRGFKEASIGFNIKEIPCFLYVDDTLLTAKAKKRLDALWRNFLWQSNKDRSFHSVKWSSTSIGRGGGLAIRNLRQHNSNLLMKRLRRYNSEEQELLREVITMKYGQESPRCSKQSSSPIEWEYGGISKIYGPLLDQILIPNG
ncbi:uncharacterized protein LOC142181669 [Nicotiana tabacum]|uniref:Uncharacterized protein LOC142181669 n=1 Tax=Nicotiana tabacum TaxID=4097 RepID=A0AC58UNU2_TOBAC